MEGTFKFRVIFPFLKVDVLSHCLRFGEGCAHHTNLWRKKSYGYFFPHDVFDLFYVVLLRRCSECVCGPFAECTTRSTNSVNIVCMKNGDVKVDHMRYAFNV